MPVYAPDECHTSGSEAGEFVSGCEYGYQGWGLWFGGFDREAGRSEEVSHFAYACSEDDETS